MSTPALIKRRSNCRGPRARSNGVLRSAAAAVVIVSTLLLSAPASSQGLFGPGKFKIEQTDDRFSTSPTTTTVGENNRVTKKSPVGGIYIGPQGLYLNPVVVRARSMNKADRVTEEVRALAALDLDGLRYEWRRHGYGEPPKMRSKELLARLLAWKIQADAFGGLDPATVRILKSDRVPKPKPLLESGTRLAREWQGRRFEVEVLEDGFLHDGTTYGSLSHVARAITGTRWNGLRFFGLREAGAK